MRQKGRGCRLSVLNVFATSVLRALLRKGHSGMFTSYDSCTYLYIYSLIDRHLISQQSPCLLENRGAAYASLSPAARAVTKSLLMEDLSREDAAMSTVPVQSRLR